MDRTPPDPPSEARRKFLLGSGAVGASAGMAGLGVATAQAQAPAVAGGEKVRVRFTLNGVQREVEIDPRVSLLDLLREQMLLTGTKKGCDRGQCGACTLLVDGRRVNSCLTLAATLEGRSVTSIEGLGRGGPLQPVQQAFVEQDALQCGYCTPGQVMSCVALLQETRGRSIADDEIREGMSGNICRCGAYVNIVAAVREAAKRSPGR